MKWRYWPTSVKGSRKIHNLRNLPPELVCGVPVIDEQHRKLLASVLMLQEQAQNNVGRSTLMMLLAELLKDLTVHFKTEESLIEIIDSEDARAHINEHAAYLHDVEMIYGKAMMRADVDWSEFLSHLERVLHLHIAHKDAPLYREVRKRLQPSPALH